MSKFYIVVADWEQEYVSRLGARFPENFGDVADIEMITERAFFDGFLSQRQRIDWLIIGDNIYSEYSEQLKRHDITNIIRLSETPPDLTGPIRKGDFLLYKYISMKEIFAIMKPCLSQSPQAQTHLVCVYSPVGGSGTTTVALALTSALAQTRKNVLYLSTESFQSAAMLLPEKEAPSAEFCDALLSGAPELPSLLPAECGHAGFDYLRPFPNSIANHNLTVRHFQRLAELLKETGYYSFIVMECSSELNQEKTQLMGVCDRVVIVTCQGQAAEWKTQALLRSIIISDKKKFLAVCNRYQAGRSDRIKDILRQGFQIQSVIPELPDEICSSPERLGAEDDIAKLALRLL